MKRDRAGNEQYAICLQMAEAHQAALGHEEEANLYPMHHFFPKSATEQLGKHFGLADLWLFRRGKQRQRLVFGQLLQVGQRE